MLNRMCTLLASALALFVCSQSPFSAYVIYLPNNEDQTISVINSETNQLLFTIPCSDRLSSGAAVGPVGVAFSPDGETAYVSLSNGTVSVIETLANRVIASGINIGQAGSATYLSGAIAVSPDGNYLYILDTIQEQLAEIDLSDYATNGFWDFTGQGPSGFSIAGDGTLYIVLERDQTHGLLEGPPGVIGSTSTLSSSVAFQSLLKRGEPISVLEVAKGLNRPRLGSSFPLGLATNRKESRSDPTVETSSRVTKGITPTLHLALIPSTVTRIVLPVVHTTPTPSVTSAPATPVAPAVVPPVVPSAISNSPYYGTLAVIPAPSLSPRTLSYLDVGGTPSVIYIPPGTAQTSLYAVVSTNQIVKVTMASPSNVTTYTGSSIDDTFCSLVVRSDGTGLYAGGSSGQIYFFDTALNAGHITYISVAGGPVSLSLTSDSNTLYAFEEGSHELYVINSDPTLKTFNTLSSTSIEIDSGVIGLNPVAITPYDLYLDPYLPQVTLTIMPTIMGDPRGYDEIVFKLFVADVPLATGNFIALAEMGYYNGTRFSQIYEHKIRGGCLRSISGQLKSSYNNNYFISEQNTRHDFSNPYMVAMCNETGTTGGVGSLMNGTTFFISDAILPDWMDQQRTIIGELISGQAVVDQIATLANSLGDLSPSITITQVTIRYPSPLP